MISIAVDADRKMVWFRVNGGDWNGSSTNDPARNLGGKSFMAFSGAVYPCGGAFRWVIAVLPTSATCHSPMQSLLASLLAGRHKPQMARTSRPGFTLLGPLGFRAGGRPRVAVSHPAG